jgi:hypothetical protein
MIRLEKFALRQLIAVFALSLVMGGLLVGLFERIVPDDNSLPLGVDVYPRWAGSQAFWRGESPYSAAVDGETQSYVFGRPALPGEDTFGFYYPAHIAIVLGPLFLLPARAAALLWTAVTWAILSVLIFLITQSMPGRASPWLLLLVALSIFLQRSAVLVVLNGQYVFFILACWGMAYYLIHHNHEIPAGVLLALSTIKPSLSALPLLVFLVWAFRAGHKRTIVSFLLTCGLFLLVTLARIGWWLPDFLTQLGQYDSFPRQWTPVSTLSALGLVWLGGTAVLIFLGIRDHLNDPAEFPWVLFWGAISLILLATPHTAEYDLPALLLPFFVYAPRFLQTRIGAVIWGLLLWVPWLSWALFQMMGLTTSQWYAAYWFHYPQILVLALLAFLAVTRRMAGVVYNQTAQDIMEI